MLITRKIVTVTLFDKAVTQDALAAIVMMLHQREVEGRTLSGH
jgi:hypothetical protein